MSTKEEHEQGLSVLRAARCLLSEKERWTQGSFARGANGQSLGSGDGNAVCWCLLGALFKLAAKPEGYVAAIEVLEKAVRVTKHCYIDDFNDDLNTTHDDILKLLDTTIAGAESC